MADNHESIIWGLLRNWRTKKNNKRMLQNINIENENKKGIVRYQPSQIEAFFSDSDPLGNVVISGGHPEIRARTINGAIHWAYSKGLGVVVIHASNQKLEYLVENTFRGTNNITVFNTQNSIYEPFLGLSNNEISRIIQLSSTKTCEIRGNGKYYIEGLADFIRSKNVPPTCDMFIRAPHLTIFDKLDEAENNGHISNSLAQKIRIQLVQGQTDRSDVETFFSILRHQGGGLFAYKNTIAKSSNIYNMLSRDGIAIIDVVSSTNFLLINLVLNEIESSLARGKKMMIIFDELSITSSELLNTFIMKNSAALTILASNDLYSMVGGDDKNFAAVVGKASKVFIYTHTSSISSTKWSEMIGYYDKNEVSNTFTGSKNYQSMFSIVPGTTDTNTTSINSKREYIIKPEEITKMAYDEAYVFDSSSRELAYTKII